MQRRHLAFLFALAAAAVALGAAPTIRKDPYGVYGVIDSVRLEGGAEKPERIQVWGVFAMADNIGIEDGKVSYVQVGAFKPAARGYLYYTLNRRDETITRAEWSAMKALAGTRVPVAFGAPFPPVDSIAPAGIHDMVFAQRILAYNGRLRRAGEPLATPDTFPLRAPGVAATMHAPSAKAAAHKLFDVP